MWTFRKKKEEPCCQASLPEWVAADLLACHVGRQAKKLTKAAQGHKRLHRFLWFAASLLSLGVALSANFDFAVAGYSSDLLASVFSIVTPVVAGYAVHRSPKELWLLEVDIRNQLLDLHMKICLAAENHDKKDNLNMKPFRDQYFEIMDQANKRWLELKKYEEGGV